jgi:DNA-binding LacI/PurR family transcriptional regulator
MRDLGYQHGGRGRGRVPSRRIAAVVPDASSLFFADALATAEKVLREEGFVLMVGSSSEDPGRERALIAGMRKAGVDGLILTPSGEVPAEVEEFAANGGSVVIMDREGGSPRLSRVAMNNYGAAFRAIRLLIESGHRRIALVNGPEHISTAREQLRGYREALSFAEVPIRAEYIRLGPFSVDQGLQSTRALLALPEPPDAIFSTSVLLTSGVLLAIRERGLRWPNDIAVVGFGDAVWASLLTPPLTVIERPSEQLGETAARLVLAGLERGSGGQHVVLDSRLVLRESHWRAPQAPRSESGPAVAS